VIQEWLPERGEHPSTSPIHINDLTEDEATFATEYFQNQGKKVSVEA